MLKRTVIVHKDDIGTIIRIQKREAEPNTHFDLAKTLVNNKQIIK